MPDDSQNLISQYVEKLDPGAMVTKFVIIAEGIDSDGDRASYSSTHEDATSWDIMGLLLYGLVREVAALVVSVIDESKGDEDEEGET